MQFLDENTTNLDRKMIKTDLRPGNFELAGFADKMWKVYLGNMQLALIPLALEIHARQQTLRSIFYICTATN